MTAQTSAPPALHRPVWQLAIGGVGAAVVGLLPWMVTGLRLPLQNLWAEEVLPDQMPLALLPFSQYTLTLLLGMLVWGPAVAGLLARRAPVESRTRAAVGAALGTLLVAAVAVAQTVTVVSSGLRPDDPRSDLYLAGVLAVIVGSVAVGLAVLVLLARAPRAAASVGATMAAIAAGIWLDALIVPVGDVATGAQLTALGVTRWVPAVLVGAALVWCGTGGAGKVVAWFVDLLLLWLVPAALIAVSYAAGSRVLAGDPGEMLAAARDVFVLAAGPAGVSLQYAALALLIGGVGSAVRALLRRRRAR